MFYLPAILMVCAVSAAAPAAHNLLPVPTTLVPHQGHLNLSAPFAIQLDPPIDAGSGKILKDARVDHAVAQLRQLLAERTHHNVCLSPCQSAVRLSISWDAASSAVQRVSDPEGYNLDVHATHASLNAKGPLGVLRGLQTLTQWLQTDATGTTLAAVHIVDAPRFAWRGLLLDTARHFMPAATVKRNLDAMAAVKLNVLHWHLSDDQGFRVESLVFPELSAQGSNGEFYTQAEVRDIVAYAANLGIRVVPEFDMPGHTASWFLSHPELASDSGPHVAQQTWGIFDSALDPSRESTFEFVDKLLGEMTALFPDAYFHVGGDEVSGVAWRNNPHIVAFMQAHQLADAHALQTYFINRVAKLANAYGKHVVGWDEILQPGLDDATVIQSWRGPDGVRQSLAAGYQSLLSHGWYLGGTAAAHYLNDPATGLDTQTASSHKLLGGEACLWSELVTPELVDATIWPRAAAVAERLWSAADVRDVPDMYRRLAVQSDRLVALGVNHRSYQEQRLVELAGTPHVVPLQLLASVIESRRENWWPSFKTKRPLDGFFDVVYAESDTGRALEAASAALLADPDDLQAAHSMRTTFAALKANGPALAAMLRASRALQDIGPVAAHIAHLSDIGLQALDALQAHRTLPQAFAAQATAALAQADDKALGIYIALAPSIAQLVERVCPAGAHTADAKKEHVAP